jgi:predicted cobalt transporter CbtA
MRQQAVIGAGITAAILGIILTAAPSFVGGAHPTSAAAVSPTPVAAAAVSETFRIVPSPVIDSNVIFFLGTGDGNGSYSDRSNN